VGQSEGVVAGVGRCELAVGRLEEEGGGRSVDVALGEKLGPEAQGRSQLGHLVVDR
jgi:hypothetical protein